MFRVAGTLAETLYIGPFRNAINVGSNTSYLDIQVGQAFIRQFREFKTGANRKLNLQIIQLIENIRQIFEFDSLTVEPSADDQSLHIVINGKPYKQHELGSGLTQFVLVLANASTRRPRMILIDEPELNLHPRLQLDFLTTLGSYAEDGVWFSTHSVGLARAAAERVYSVLRRGEGDSILRPLAATTTLSEFLGEMSFSSHKELGFERLLLVEGPSEVKTIQQILRKMNKDHKIVLLPIHGHIPRADDLEEILRITRDVAALIDSERTAVNQPLSAERQEFIDRCTAIGLKCHALDWRATENYFPDAIIKQVFGPSYRGLRPYEKLVNADPHWSKSLNWKLAAALPLEQIIETDLGQFLSSL